jgi:hypothetical protein
MNDYIFCINLIWFLIWFSISELEVKVGAGKHEQQYERGGGEKYSSLSGLVESNHNKINDTTHRRFQ